MNPIIENFLAALKLVDKEHYHTPQVMIIEDEVNVFHDHFTTYENNFVTQLNEKYAILSHVGSIAEPKELIRQFQIPKRLVWGQTIDQHVEECFNKLNDYLGGDVDLHEELKTIPDFIIHKSQADKTPDNQRFIAEVKTERGLPFNRFAWDFFKLNIYVEKLNFQVVCFLAINVDFEKIAEYLAQYKKLGFILPKSQRDSL